MSVKLSWDQAYTFAMLNVLSNATVKSATQIHDTNVCHIHYTSLPIYKSKMISKYGS